MHCSNEKKKKKKKQKKKKKKNILHMRKHRRGSVTAKLISAFVFAARIVQYLLLLNLKFPACSDLQCLYSSVCVGPVRKLHCCGSYSTVNRITIRKPALIFGNTNEPRREKTGLRGFRPGPTQTGLYSHRSRLEA